MAIFNEDQIVPHCEKDENNWKIKCVEVAVDSEEWKEVVQLFRRSIQNKVEKRIRIENDWLWDSYANQKRRMSFKTEVL